MSWHSLFFYTALPCACLYAAWRGGRSELSCALIILIGSLTSTIAQRMTTRHFQSTEIELLAVDLIVLGAFIWVALASSRFWPLLIAGLQMATVAVHLAKLAEPSLPPFAYAIGTQVWGHAMIPIIVVGTWRHHQRMMRA